MRPAFIAKQPKVTNDEVWIVVLHCDIWYTNATTVYGVAIAPVATSGNLVGIWPISL